MSAFKSDMSKLLGAVAKMDTKATYENNDELFWKLERDKADNGSAVIRFLPEAPGKLPLVRKFDHGFKADNGKWFIELCPTTINQPCPLCELNGTEWAKGTDAAKAVARGRKRRLNYIANILVISDPKHPENEGKVFMYQFGKSIYDMILDKIKPTYEDETPVNVFDPIDGANFKIRARKADGWVTYDKSVFESPSALFDGNEKQISALVDQLHDIEGEVGPDKIKSAEEFKRKLDGVLGIIPTQQAMKAFEDVEVDDDEPAPAPVQERAAKPMPKKIVADDGDDDDSEYFARLAAL